MSSGRRLAWRPRRCASSLGGGVVQVDLRRAGEFELAAGLERDAADGVVAQADRVVAVVERVPAGAPSDAVEQGVDAVVARHRGRGGAGSCGRNVLFVLGADAPFGLGLLPRAMASIRSARDSISGEHFRRRPWELRDSRACTALAGRREHIASQSRKQWLLSPIADDCLNHRQSGHGGGVGAQDARAETDRNHKGLREQ